MGELVVVIGRAHITPQDHLPVRKLKGGESFWRVRASRPPPRIRKSVEFFNVAPIRGIVAP